jgi:hypothetical protein
MATPAWEKQLAHGARLPVNKSSKLDMEFHYNIDKHFYIKIPISRQAIFARRVTEMVFGAARL